MAAIRRAREAVPFHQENAARVPLDELLSDAEFARGDPWPLLRLRACAATPRGSLRRGRRWPPGGRGARGPTGPHPPLRPAFLLVNPIAERRLTRLHPGAAHR